MRTGNPRSLFSLGFALTLAACGGTGSVSPDPSQLYLHEPSQPDGTLSSGEAVAFKSYLAAALRLAQLTSAVTSVSDGMLAGTQFQLDSPQAVANWGGNCAPAVSGDATDSDHDSEAVNATYTYACPASQASQTTGYSGQFTIKDANDASAFPLAGYDLALNGFGISLYLDSSNPKAQTASLNMYGTRSISTSGGTWSTSSAYSFGLKITEGTDNSGRDLPAVAGYAGVWLRSTLQPTTASQPDTSGTITTLSGHYAYYNDTHKFTLEISGTGLPYGTAGSMGTVALKDGAGNVVTFTYSSSSVTAAYNGTSI